MTWCILKGILGTIIISEYANIINIIKTIEMNTKKIMNVKLSIIKRRP